MARFANEKEVLDRVHDLREAHSLLRGDVTVRTALNCAYANGKQWNRTQQDDFGNIDQFDVDEDWDPHASEIRVVDNKIGPLVRRVAASTNATRIEFAVHPPKHKRGIEDAHRAKIAQMTLNGLDESGGFTRAARRTSYLRWMVGSHLIIATLSRKANRVSANVATNPDGTPIEVNDQWIRWKTGLLADLIWDPVNKSRDLADHSVLIYEQILTQQEFEQTYNKIGVYGFKDTDLPEMKDMAVHQIAAAAIDGCGLFDQYKHASKAKAIRVIELIESDPNDPNQWPELYLILDTTPHLGGRDRVQGKVVNRSNPKTPYGFHGRNIFKLDAFPTGDSVWSWGIPSILMSKNDMINIMRSLQFNDLTGKVFGHWLIDKRAGNKETFAGELAAGTGGILTYSGGEGHDAPVWVSNSVQSSEWIPGIAELSQAMDADVHISPINKGIGKTHVDRQTQQDILSESKVVVDNIIQEDKDTYAEAGKVTLGTIRLAFDSPNRMIARLRDDHGFGQRELETLQEIDPRRVNLTISVREDSIISRSVDERTQQLDQSLAVGLISPEEHTLAMVSELERPITQSQAREVEFIRRLVVDIVNTEEPFQGQPSINFRMFTLVATLAIHGLDPTDEDDLPTIARLEAAIEKQRTIALEKAQQEQGALDAPPPQNAGAANGSNGSAPFPGGPPQGAPESINPVTSPVGAAGGLPLGLGA